MHRICPAPAVVPRAPRRSRPGAPRNGVRQGQCIVSTHSNDRGRCWTTAPPPAGDREEEQRGRRGEGVVVGRTRARQQAGEGERRRESRREAAARVTPHFVGSAGRSGRRRVHAVEPAVPGDILFLHDLDNRGRVSSRRQRSRGSHPGACRGGEHSPSGICTRCRRPRHAPCHGGHERRNHGLAAEIDGSPLSPPPHTIENLQSRQNSKDVCRKGNPVLLAVGETVILLRPLLLSVAVSIGMERECQQNDSLADG